MCPNCGTAVDANAKFCQACGIELELEAGSEKREGTYLSHIASSGPVSTAEPQRRQLTVLFCDLVGSTALSERLDPEDLRDLLQAYQRACSEAIARYEGYVAQYRGDGVIAYCGWPCAHEDDAVRAISAGLNVIDAISYLDSAERLRVRIGIDTGLVVVGGATDARGSFLADAIGETPNIAARIQSLAESGAVLVSERTAKLTQGSFNFMDRGVMQ